MRVIYKSTLYYTDSDFPTVRALQKRGIDVVYYISVNCFQLRAALVDIKKQYPKAGILPASVYKEFQPYKEYLDLSQVYVINRTHKSKYHPSTLLLYLKTFFHMRKQKCNAFHILNPLFSLEKIYYFLNLHIVLTLHDPFVHSGRGSKRGEKDRIISFKKADKIVLLNKAQKDEFMNFYKIPQSKITISKMGDFDYMDFIKPKSYKTERHYILFFGLIAEYKGLEFLIQAMLKIHDQHPDVKLVVAGGGKIYFDMTPFKDLDYIEIHNHYVSVPELAGLLKGCTFSVCPYKDATQSGVIQTAFSLGVPMVVTNVGALPDAVKDGVTGLVVPPCDIDALAEAMNKLLDNPALLADMHNNIETKWKQEMSWEPIADKYIECYKCYKS